MRLGTKNKLKVNVLIYSQADNCRLQKTLSDLDSEVGLPRVRNVASLFNHSIKFVMVSAFCVRAISLPNLMLSWLSNLLNCDITNRASAELLTEQPFCSILFVKLRIFAA